MTILILIADERNSDPVEVTRFLREADAPVVVVNPRDIVTAASLSTPFGAPARSAVIRTASTELELGAVTAVWSRTNYAHGLPEPLGRLAPGVGELCWRTAQQHLHATLSGLDALHLDPYFRAAEAGHKVRQLDAATKLGLAIPRTLISNDPGAVRDFARSCSRGLVTKMLTDHFVPMPGHAEKGAVFTNTVRPQDLEDLEGLRLCPMIFQEQIPKQLEIRSTVVGHRVFSAAVDSRVAEGGRVDWRRDQRPLLGTWRPYELPNDVQVKLLQLHDALGLNYGGSDFILTPEGQHVFLELNPLGGFNWLETNMERGHFPISAAIADLLLGRAPPRVGVIR